MSTRLRSQRAKNAPTRYSPEADAGQITHHRTSREQSDRHRSPSEGRHHGKRQRKDEKRRSKSSHSARHSRSESRTTSRHTHRASRSNSPRPTSSRHREDDTTALRRDFNDLREKMTDIQDMLWSIHGPSNSRHTADVMDEAPMPMDHQTPPMTTPPAMAMNHQTPMTTTPANPTTSGNFINPSDMSDILHMYTPTPRPVITAGVNITATVPQQLKEKIWRDEYIQLSQLLPQQSTRFTEAFTLALCPETNNQLGFRLAKPKPKTLTLQQWEDCFLTYMAVYADRHKDVTSDMCTYMRDVKEIGRRNGNFLYYDEQFRQERATTHCSWAAVHNGLHFQATTPFPAPQKPTSQYRHNTTKIPTGFCNNYHTRGVVCQTQRCRYKHVCPNCDERHPVYRCQSKNNSGKGSVQNRSDNTQQHPQSNNIKPKPNANYTSNNK